MSLPANIATIPAVLKQGDLPAEGAFVGQQVLVAANAAIAKWDGSSWVQTPVQTLSLDDLSGISQMPVQADSTAAMLADLVTDFNLLLGKLKTAGLMASS